MIKYTTQFLTKLEDLIAGNTDSIADAAGGMVDKAKGLFGG